MLSKQSRPKLLCEWPVAAGSVRAAEATEWDKLPTSISLPPSLCCFPPSCSLILCLAEAHCLSALCFVHLHNAAVQWPLADPTWVTCLFTHREGGGVLVISQVELLVCKAAEDRWEVRTQIKRILARARQSYTLFYGHRTTIVAIRTLPSRSVLTASPEYKQSTSKFPTGICFAHYRIVLFRSVHSLKTTSSNDCETLWLEGSICVQAIQFSNKGLTADCAGLRGDVIWARVTWSSCFCCGQWGKIWCYIPQKVSEGKAVNVNAQIFLKTWNSCLWARQLEGMVCNKFPKGEKKNLCMQSSFLTIPWRLYP